MSIHNKRIDRINPVNVKKENVCIAVMNRKLNSVEKKYVEDKYGRVNEYIYLNDELKKIWNDVDNVHEDKNIIDECVDKIVNFIKINCSNNNINYIIMQGEYDCMYRIGKIIRNELNNIYSIIEWY